MKHLWTTFAQFWEGDRGLSVFLALLVIIVFVVPPLAPVKPLGRFIVDLVFSLLLIAGASAVSERRWPFALVSAAIVAALLVRWGSWLIHATDLTEARAWSTMVSFGLFALVVLAQVFRRGPVTVHRIQGAVAAYLLLGLAWSEAYKLVALRNPGAFTGAVGGEDGSLQNWLYYSFVTLTTLGYGDIAPAHPAARSLAVLEALTGQLYPAILLARMVSLEAQSHR